MAFTTSMATGKLSIVASRSGTRALRLDVDVMVVFAPDEGAALMRSGARLRLGIGDEIATAFSATDPRASPGGSAEECRAV